jgi:CRISPR-associated protein Csy2
MRSILLLERIRVENANAISGMTWGFPAVTNFLGFTHALSRFVQQKYGLKLGGCGIICHWHQVKAYRPNGRGEYVFGLSRNPLVKKGKDFVTAPFNEEGKMHMEVSLIIESDFDYYALPAETGNDDEDIKLFTQQLRNKILTLRLAGGTIQEFGRVQFEQIPESQEERPSWTRRKLLRLLPGFALVDRSELLAQHFQHLKEQQPDTELLDAWMDFSALKYRAIPDPDITGEPDEETPATWEREPNPAKGYLVPIVTGYQAISPLYEPGEVAHTRDSTTPFRFIESVYGVGQWVSPHRVKNLDHLIWRYEKKDTGYFCVNNFKTAPEAQ